MDQGISEQPNTTGNKSVPMTSKIIAPDKNK
jgi:hypothetical protein